MGTLNFAINQPGHTFSIPSASVSDGSAVIVAVEDVGQNAPLALVTSDYGGYLWTPITTFNPPGIYNQPIVKLVSPTQGFVAYEVAGNGSYGIEIDQIYRYAMPGGVYSSWSSHEEFHVSGLQTRQLEPGALNRQWNQFDPISFDVGGTASNGDVAHLYLSYPLSSSSGVDRLILWDCVEEATPTVLAARCGTTDSGAPNGNWRMQRVAPPGSIAPGDQLVPNVVASIGSQAMGITWFSRTSTVAATTTSNPADSTISIFGTYSTDEANHFQGTWDVRPNHVAWTPCPSLGGTPSGESANMTPGVYTDYNGSALLPVTIDQATSSATSFIPSNAPAIVTAHADSAGGCVNNNQSEFDLHVQAAIW